MIRFLKGRGTSYAGSVVVKKKMIEDAANLCSNRIQQSQLFEKEWKVAGGSVTVLQTESRA